MDLGCYLPLDNSVQRVVLLGTKDSSFSCPVDECLVVGLPMKEDTDSKVIRCAPEDECEEENIDSQGGCGQNQQGDDVES